MVGTMTGIMPTYIGHRAHFNIISGANATEIITFQWQMIEFSLAPYF